jgi:hypothetical protein
MEHTSFLRQDEKAFILPTVLFGIATISIGIALAIATLLTSWKLTEEYQFYIHHQQPARFETFFDSIGTENSMGTCTNQLCAIDIKTLHFRHPLHINQNTAQLDEMHCNSERHSAFHSSGIVHPHTCSDTLQLSRSMQIKGNIIADQMTVLTSDDLTILVEGSVHSSLDINAGNTIYLLSAGDVLLERINTEVPVTLWILSATGSIMIHTVDPRIALFTSAKDTQIGNGSSYTEVPEYNQFMLHKILLSYGTQVD